MATITKRAGEPRPVARQNAGAILLALVVFAQLTALGADTGVLSAAAACLNIAAAGIALLLVAPPPRFWRLAAPVLALLGAALLWAVLPELAEGTGFATIDATIAPRLAPDLLGVETSNFFGFVAALLLGALIGHRRGSMRDAIGWILLFAAINLAIGLVLRQIDPHAVWGLRRAVGGDRFSGTLLNVNAAACGFGAVALLAAGKWLELRAESTDAMSRNRGLLAGLVAVLAVAAAGACVVSASRTATAMVLAGLLLLFLLEWIASRGRQRWLALLFAVATVAALAAVIHFAGEIIQQRTVAIGGDATYRAGIWTRYWALAGQSPWFGYGLGAFADLNLHYLKDPAEAAAFWYINDAHNSVLQLLLEGGWPYLALISAALGMILWSVLAQRRRRADPLFRAVLIALAVMLGCAMTDIALSVPAIITFASVLLGLLWGRAIRTRIDRDAVSG